MPTTKTAAEKLQEAINSDPFLAGNDVNLDLSGFPHLQTLADAPAEEFAPIDTRGMGIGSSALKRFLTAPDREAVQELRDPEALKKFDEQHGSGTVVHASGIPFKVTERGGKWHSQGKVNGQLHRFTADSRDALYPKIMGAVNQNVIKELTRSQELAVIRLCQAGRENEGIALYLEGRIGEDRGSRYGSAAELTSDVALLDVMNECASFTWFHSRPDVQDSPEFQSFADAYLAERPVTHQLLDAAHDAFRREQKQQYRHELLKPEPETAPTARQIDELDDASVDRLMVDTKKQFVREVRAGTR